MIIHFTFKQYRLLSLFFVTRVITCNTTEESSLSEDTYTTYTTIELGNTTTEDCDITPEVPNYQNITTISLNVININPPEVTVDEKIELQLTIAHYCGTNSTPVFCFLTTPDNNFEVLSSFWISPSQINCQGFSPLVSGFFIVRAGSSNVRTNIDKILKVVSKRPIAEHAEYSNSLREIFIHFDANVELRSDCAGVFSRKSLEHFGRGFKCSTVGNVLAVRMGVDFKPTGEVEIIDNNKICRSETEKGICKNAKPKKLNVKAPKVSDPKLSLLTTSDCTGNAPQKYVSLKLGSNDEKKKSGKVSPPGKTQRKNLIMWRSLRKIQNKLPSNMTFKLDKANMERIYENLESVENFLESGTIESGTPTPGLTVSLHVQSSPAAGIIVAEADVIFCKNTNQLYRYKWMVNEKVVDEDGKILTFQKAIPGKYIIKCYIIAYNSSEVLGQAWSTAEILQSKQRVIIYPVELVSGGTEDISLSAVGCHDGITSWTCRTNADGVCRTNARKLITQVVDMKSCNVSIPAGILPPGEYVWTIENAVGVNTAKIIIKPENIAAVQMETASVFVERSQRIVFHGKVKGLHNGCKLWWSSARQKGFNYINLQNVGVDTEVLVEDDKSEQKFDLVLPPRLKQLQSESLYMFKLEMFCPHSGTIVYMKVAINVIDPPRVSSIELEPKKGLSMTTNFILSEVAVEHSMEYYPLLFEWSYSDSCGVETPIMRGTYSRQITTFLPPGDVRANLKICDVRGFCSKVSSSVIDVSHAKIVPENFHTASDQIYYLIVGGDFVEAFGLATTVFKSLALKVAPEIRRGVFKAVEEGIRMRVEKFNKNMATDPERVKSNFEFVERALNVTKYFPKLSNITGYLSDFKGRILKSGFGN